MNDSEKYNELSEEDVTKSSPYDHIIEEEEDSKYLKY